MLHREATAVEKGHKRFQIKTLFVDANTWEDREHVHQFDVTFTQIAYSIERLQINTQYLKEYSAARKVKVYWDWVSNAVKMCKYSWNRQKWSFTGEENLRLPECTSLAAFQDHTHPDSVITMGNNWHCRYSLYFTSFLLYSGSYR